ncbi:hypothetical protein FBF29_02415 [Candidatus Saccharibacteria bacterium oral taxon 488]|jgi:hypothetical protein|nr:hypothetical protein FBF29_02415 [Candidatus Saccharibacteria bacterium oral taxon 488]
MATISEAKAWPDYDKVTRNPETDEDRRKFFEWFGQLTYRKVEDGELSYEDLERLHPTIQQAVEIALNLYMESQQEAAREATETQ